MGYTPTPAHKVELAKMQATFSSFKNDKDLTLHKVVSWLERNVNTCSIYSTGRASRQFLLGNVYSVDLLVKDETYSAVVNCKWHYLNMTDKPVDLVKIGQLFPDIKLTPDTSNEYFMQLTLTFDLLAWPHLKPSIIYTKISFGYDKVIGAQEAKDKAMAEAMVLLNKFYPHITDAYLRAGFDLDMFESVEAFKTWLSEAHIVNSKVTLPSAFDLPGKG